MERARFVASPGGRRAIASVPAEWASLSALSLATRLRGEFPAREAAAIGEQITLRTDAAERLFHTEALLSSDGLQMMTHPSVAARRASRLATIGLPVADLTAGLGGDLYACIAAGLVAVGVERQPATALLAGANTGGRVVLGDATAAPAPLERMTVVVDPSRRDGSGRRFDPARFAPQWSVAIQLARAGRAGVVKGPPGIPYEAVPGDAEIEFVQLGRSLRESALWFGAEARPGLRRAVLLPAGAVITSDDADGYGDVAPPGAFLFDPESCVTRAGLVTHLATRLGASMMDPQVAYLTGAVAMFDPLCATFEILDVAPFSVGRLKARMREQHWRADEIRRRAFPVEPDELRRLLGRQVGDAVTLLCTTIGGRRTVFVVRRVRDDNCARV